jgi:hypothetical protein
MKNMCPVSPQVSSKAKLQFDIKSSNFSIVKKNTVMTLIKCKSDDIDKVLSMSSLLFLIESLKNI